MPLCITGAQQLFEAIFYKYVCVLAMYLVYYRLYFLYTCLLQLKYAQ